LGERAYVALGERVAEPRAQVVAATPPLAQHDLRGGAQRAQSSEKGRVLELAVVESAHQLPQPLARRAGRYQRSHDRAGRRSGDLVEAKTTLLQHRYRSDQRDSLDAATLEYQVSVERTTHELPSSVITYRSSSH
jgi:hypothetical protein